MIKQDRSTNISQPPNCQKSKINFSSFKQKLKGHNCHWFNLECLQVQPQAMYKPKASTFIKYRYEQPNLSKLNIHKCDYKQSASIHCNGRPSKGICNAVSLRLSKNNSLRWDRKKGLIGMEHPTSKSTGNFCETSQSKTQANTKTNDNSCSSLGKKHKITLDSSHEKFSKVFERLREIYIFDHDTANTKTPQANQIISYPITSKPTQQINLRKELPYLNVTLHARKRSKSHEPNKQSSFPAQQTKQCLFKLRKGHQENNSLKLQIL